ncbi:hypothetical protein GOP47_0024825 [Adiantum capillus-veneris]|uniref:Elongation factor Ts, mitochondrial n=1 Tax=Adiantum capillus-veneris TaxID=13818 RepID=A0A9D4U3J7_ADICA|nr:hypothetical protein GOP47_0024825 [Adiantum capillus-veneris]
MNHLGRVVRQVSQRSRSYSTEGASPTALIRQLREKSSAPMKDVKTALVQCNWDMEAAFTELRKKGLAAVSKKASRAATEGLLALCEKPGMASIIELNSETDFVARNDVFQHLASRVAQAALSLCETESTSPGHPSDTSVIDLHALESVRIKLDHPKLTREGTVQEAIQEAASIIGENLKLRRAFHVCSNSGLVSSYLHASLQPGLGKTAGLLTLNMKDGSVKAPLQLMSSVGESLAMHIVAARPLFLSKECVTKEVWEHEKSIILSQVSGSNKPEQILNKMVEGRLRKYVEEVVLLDQKFAMNDKITVQQVVEDLSKQAGVAVEIGCYLRMEVGETTEREESMQPTEAVAQAG